MFVDRIKIELQAGKGGDGCTSMRREKFVPRGGPDGGDGGDGASIILEARLGVNSLAELANRQFFRARAVATAKARSVTAKVLKITPSTFLRARR